MDRLRCVLMLLLCSLVLLTGCQRLGMPMRAADEPEPRHPGLVFRNVGTPGLLPHETFYVHYAGNPIIPGENIYAPSPVRFGNTWFVYYGGWSTYERTGHDDIYLATTTDPTLRGPYTSHDIIIRRGIYIHANDPSVVRLDDGWIMALTVFVDGKDWIAVATSHDGYHWTPDEFVDHTFEIAIDGADFDYVARPSLNFNPQQQRWELYFDGRITTEPENAQFVAHSYEPVPYAFDLVGRIDHWMDADIRRLPDGRYIAAYRHSREEIPVPIRFAHSDDGVDFTEYGIFIQPDPVNPYDDQAVTNPGWAIDPDGTIVAVLFGGSDHGMIQHSIGIAYPQAAGQPIGEVAHNFRQALGPNRQLVRVPPDETFRQFVLWRRTDCPVARFELPVPQRAGDEVPVRMPGGECLPLERFTSPFERTEDPQPYLPQPEGLAKVFTASSAHSDELAPHYLGTRGGFWSSQGHEMPDALEWVQTELPEVMWIGGVSLRPRQAGWGFPVSFSLEYSRDGEEWFYVPDHEFFDFANPGSQTVTFTFARPLQMRYFRIVATELSPDQFDFYYFQLARMQLHPAPPPRR
jgi:hypothetical protein